MCNSRDASSQCLMPVTAVCCCSLLVRAFSERGNNCASNNGTGAIAGCRGCGAPCLEYICPTRARYLREYPTRIRACPPLARARRRSTDRVHRMWLDPVKEAQQHGSGYTAAKAYLFYNALTDSVRTHACAPATLVPVLKIALQHEVQSAPCSRVSQQHTVRQAISGCSEV